MILVMMVEILLWSHSESEISEWHHMQQLSHFQTLAWYQININYFCVGLSGSKIQNQSSIGRLFQTLILTKCGKRLIWRVYRKKLR